MVIRSGSLAAEKSINLSLDWFTTTHHSPTILETMPLYLCQLLRNGGVELSEDRETRRRQRVVDSSHQAAPAAHSCRLLRTDAEHYIVRTNNITSRRVSSLDNLFDVRRVPLAEQGTNQRSNTRTDFSLMSMGRQKLLSRPGRKDVDALRNGV